MISNFKKHALCVGFLCLFLMSYATVVVAQTSTIGMTCFPPPPAPGDEPGIGPAPPCLLPSGLDLSLSAPNATGSAIVQPLGNGTTKFTIDLAGLEPGLIITAWISYYFPGGPVAPHPIFDPIGPGLPPIAGVSAPLTSTSAAFTEGLGLEPNQFVIKPNKTARLIVNLDYDPLLPGQGPLRNGMVTTNQALAPSGHEAEQSLCCPDGFPVTPSYQPVGSSFLRAYDLNTGYQQLDGNGRPVLIRSPRAVDFIALVVHTDKTTHGINPGIPILPIPGLSATTGDHYLLGIFDLRALHPAGGSSTIKLNSPANELNEDGFRLSSVYPNPFNPTTSFQLQIAESQLVLIEVYDMLGRFVARLNDGVLSKEQAHLFSFDASNLASGRYILRATGERFVTNQNITLVK